MQNQFTRVEQMGITLFMTISNYQFKDNGVNVVANTELIRS